MFLGMPLPTWKQILNRKTSRTHVTYYEETMDDVFLMSESCESINLVLNAIKAVGKKDCIKILIPDYFCNQTIYSFQEEWVEVVFYPILKDFNPDWEYLKRWTKENRFDAFIFTHYFGKFFDSISRAKELCKNHEAVLIEDCAHVLYPTGKIGTFGDFVIYSPHKQLPIPDGAVLVCDKDEKKPMISLLEQWIEEKYDNISRLSVPKSWFIKKSIQKILPVHRKLTYYAGVHFGDEKGALHNPKRISIEGYNTLCDYDYKELKRIAYIRRDNLTMMNYIISKKYPNVLPLMDDKTGVPYVAVYSLKNVSDKQVVVRKMIEDGFTVLYWPDLPVDIKNNETYKNSIKLSEDIIVIPIHQDMTPQRIAKAFV